MSTDGAPDPQAVYTSRRAEREATRDRLAGRERAISNARLAVFTLVLATGWLAWTQPTVALAWVLVPLAGFAALVLWHDAVIRARARAERGIAFHAAGLARLDHTFAGQGKDGLAFRPSGHRYADDLDVFGEGSLFELLCSARTRGGEARLAAWLLAPAAPADVRSRQQAVAEMRGALDLREDLALLGEDLDAGVHSDRLAAWAIAPEAGLPAAARPAALGLAALAVASLLGWILGVSGPVPFVAAVLGEAVLAAATRRRVSAVLAAVEEPTRELRLLSELLERLEQERFASPHLAALRAKLDSDGAPPSQRIANLRRTVDLLDARRNQLFAPIAALLLWGTQCAYAIEGWRRATGPAVPRWLAAIAELEALSGLAGHAFEHPTDVFPEIVEGGARFDGAGLAHPLLPAARAVRNDVLLDADHALLVVSGSNMSGKSTLLRTVGTNTLLALAGAPVRAERLRVSPLALGATVRVVDSLQEGTSHFYAELTRIRDIVSAADGELPVLFLLDEIFHGTNSHDRRVGAEAIVRALLERGAIGLVTTHDLALARVADELAPRAANVHFEDEIRDGAIHFDYRMRPGIVERSNALELMRSLGLEV